MICCAGKIVPSPNHDSGRKQSDFKFEILDFQLKYLLRAPGFGISLHQNHHNSDQACEKSISVFLRHSKCIFITRICKVSQKNDFFIQIKFSQKSQHFAHFPQLYHTETHLIWYFLDFLPTSTDCNSSPRWSWVMFKHTGTMYSSRYVDSWPLKCPTTKLRTPNRVRKLIEFGQNPRSGACTTLLLSLPPLY